MHRLGRPGGEEEDGGEYCGQSCLSVQGATIQSCSQVRSSHWPQYCSHGSQLLPLKRTLEGAAVPPSIYTNSLRSQTRPHLSLSP